MNTEETNPHSTAMIVSSYVRHHTLRPEQLFDLIATVHHALSHLGQPIEEQEYNPTPIINEIRRYVDEWRKLPNSDQWQVTPETARLLQR